MQTIDQVNSGAAVEHLEVLDDLISQLGDADETVEVIEPSAEEPSIIEGAMDAAAGQIDREELYAEQSDKLQSEVIPAADTPTQTADAETTPAKTKKPRKNAAAPKEPKAPSAPRVTFHGNRRSVVLDNRLGGKTAEFLVLEMSDAQLDEQTLAIKQEMLKDELDNKIAKKVAEKCIMLFKDLGNSVPVKNEVMKTAFQVLARDSFLTSGDKGNLQLALRDRYSMGTSRSQANQMFTLFPFLKLTLQDGKGRQIPNPESALLPVINASLSIQ